MVFNLSEPISDVETSEKNNPKENRIIIPDKYQETILRLYSREKIDAPSKELINNCKILLEKIALGPAAN